MGTPITEAEEMTFLLAEKIEEVTAAVNALADALTPLDDTLDTLSDKKVEKGSQGITKMIGGLVGFTSPMGMLMDLISGITVALEPLMAIWDIMKSWFEIMGASILPYLMMALKPIMDLFIALSPIFQVLGQIVGMIMQIALIPLTVLFKILGAVLIPLMPLLDPLIKTLDKMSPIINTVTDMIVGLIMSMNFWWSIIVAIRDGLLFAFNAVWSGIKFVINGIISMINGFINGINFVLKGLGLEGIANVAYLQKGGVTTGPTLAMLHKNELVLPLEDQRAKEALGESPYQVHLLEENNRLLEESLEMQRNQYRFARLR